MGVHFFQDEAVLIRLSLFYFSSLFLSSASNSSTVGRFPFRLSGDLIRPQVGDELAHSYKTSGSI